MPGKAAKITITESQQEILRTFSRATTAPSRLRQRASIILMAFDGLLNQDIAERVGLTHRQVGRWRRRWAQAWYRLIDIECCGGPVRPLATGDRNGPGRRTTPRRPRQVYPRAGQPRFSSRRLRPLCEVRPADHPLDGPGVDRDEVVKRGIVTSISCSQVSRYLHEAALQPHKSRYWLNTTETAMDPARFEEQVKAVCETYLAAARAASGSRGTHTVCVDEMTGLQALERNAPSKSDDRGEVRIDRVPNTRAARDVVLDRQLRG